MSSTKRQRKDPPSVENVMYYARFLMENDPFKERALLEEDQTFRTLIGCGPLIVLKLWLMLNVNDLVPRGGQLKHLLWTLLYCKTYAKWKTMRTLTKTDPKTLRKWINLFFDAIGELKSHVVGDTHLVLWFCFSNLALFFPFASQIVWKNWKKGDIQNACLVSVNGTDSMILFQGQKVPQSQIQVWIRHPL